MSIEFGEVQGEKQSMSDTEFLSSIPGMVDSIKQAGNEPLESCVPYDPEEEWGKEENPAPVSH